MERTFGVIDGAIKVLWNLAYFCYNFNKLTYLLTYLARIKCTPRPRYLIVSTHSIVNMDPVILRRFIQWVSQREPIRYASPCRWNQLSASLRQLHPSLSISDSLLPVASSPSHHPQISLTLLLPAQIQPVSRVFLTIDFLLLFFFTTTSTDSWPDRFFYSSSVFSERELAFTLAICYRSSVCLSSVTFVRRTQAVQIFGDICTALGTLAIPDIHWKFHGDRPREPLRRGS